MRLRGVGRYLMLHEQGRVCLRWANDVSFSVSFYPETGVLVGGVSPTLDSYVIGW